MCICPQRRRKQGMYSDSLFAESTRWWHPRGHGREWGEGTKHRKCLPQDSAMLRNKLNAKQPRRVSLGAGHSADVQADVWADVRVKHICQVLRALEKRHFGVDIHDLKARRNLQTSFWKCSKGSEGLAEEEGEGVVISAPFSPKTAFHRRKSKGA